jgi:hypothetical protein
MVQLSRHDATALAPGTVTGTAQARGRAEDLGNAVTLTMRDCWSALSLTWAEQNPARVALECAFHPGDVA